MEENAVYSLADQFSTLQPYTMPSSVYAQHVNDAIAAAQRRHPKVPFPSPSDWRDHWIYFLLIDRFNHPTKPPNGRWDSRYAQRQGGTFKGVEAQLDYLVKLGVGAIWISPVVKNPKPDWDYSYHGYAAQDLLAIDERFASDGTAETAEKELIELVDAAHTRGLYVILDIVLNHTARVFDYLYNGRSTADFTDASVMQCAPGQEPAIEWLNGFGFPRPDWQNDLPDAALLSPDDGVWPSELQRHVFFRRRGGKLSDDIDPGQYARGDFGSMRQLVVEYDARPDSENALQQAYGNYPVLHVLIRAHQYLVAKFDFDGFRIDTVKYVDPQMIQVFGNAIREFALTIGKKNFFTFGEVYDDEQVIKSFIGRNGNTEGYGIDAALDFPLFYKLPDVAKSKAPVESIRRVFQDRKDAEADLLSSHGEAGRFFVSFLDNHDLSERFNHPLTPREQVLLGVTVQFCLQGIPCLYYGTEQGLNGTKDSQGNPDLGAKYEPVREALWGKPAGFDQTNFFCRHIARIAAVRNAEPALRYGRLYFREVSGNGVDFGLSHEAGGILAFSRVLSEREILIVANTHATRSFKGFVLMDSHLARRNRQVRVAYSNVDTAGNGTIEFVAHANFFARNQDGREYFSGSGSAATLYVELKPMEVQVIAPR